MRTTKAELIELKQEFETKLENLKAASQRYANSQQHSAEIKEWHKMTDELTGEIIKWHKTAADQSKSIELLSKQSEIDKPKIETYKKEIENMITLFKKQEQEIQNIIEDANRASMAGAFKKQADDINTKMQWTDAFLIISLLGIVGISYWGFSSSFNAENSLMWSQFLAKSAIGLPLLIVAWIKARERAYLFRLREDYAYKYSSAMAFEGYKKQIQEQDPEMQKQLLQIALDNLGDKPTKVFEKEINATPIETVIDKMATPLTK